MVKVLSFVLLSSMAIVFGIPLDHDSDSSVLANLNVGDLAQVAMSSIEHKLGESVLHSTPEPTKAYSSHVIEAHTDSAAGSVAIPLDTFKVVEPENETTLDTTSLDCNKAIEDVKHTADQMKMGALGVAAKGLLVAKNGVRLATRIIFKPIAIVTGLHLKMLGSGLKLGGKLIGGTGAGIAKAGTAIKFAGLGHIGLGASAIGWGLDKSTITTHFEESEKKFKH